MHPNFTYFYPEQPRRLEVGQALFEQLSADPGWVAEPKYNGSRLQLYCLDGAWQFWNRHGSRMAYVPCPEVLAALAGLNLQGFWHFDGELRHNKVKGVRHQIALYDVFTAAGEALIYADFGERRAALTKLFRGHIGPLSVIPQWAMDFRAAYEKLRTDQEMEGLVLKNLRGELNLDPDRGQASRWMLKVKYADEARRPTAARRRHPPDLVDYASIGPWIREQSQKGGWLNP